MEEYQAKINTGMETSSNNKLSLRPLSEKGHQPPSWLSSQENLRPTPNKADAINQKFLVNTLNRIHFLDGYVLFQFSHIKYKEALLLKAYPKPCRDEVGYFRLSRSDAGDLDIREYEFSHFIIDDGRSMIVVPATFKGIDKNEIRVQLPASGYMTGQRNAKRFTCKDINVQMIQNGFRANGNLLDYNPSGFRVKVKSENSSSFLWFNSEVPAIIHLQNEEDMFFSGLCLCIRQVGNSKNREVVLAPINKRWVPPNKRQFRHVRQKLVPPPTVIFRHPILRKKVQLEIYDITSLGFSVIEMNEERTLMPGMHMPELIIRFSGGMEITCNAQVIYSVKNENHTRSGLSILDMGVNDYSALTQILANAKETSVYVSNSTDMDALWEFFFDTGFLYPKKYRLLQANKEILKETYQKLYQNNPEIAKQFVYQKNGKIYGYISAIRAYERSWMIHHFAARSVNSRRNGFTVLYQIIHYLYDLARLPSAKMDYAMFYFRPENKFPDRVFGGFARKLGNPNVCSLDLFAYLSYPAISLGIRLPDGWSLKECTSSDLGKLDRYYRHSSGGLLVDALCLEKDYSDEEPLGEIYSRLGLIREWKIYALKFEDVLNAVLVVNQSEFGINFSELLRGIKVIVTNPENLPWNILSIGISQLIGVYGSNRVPLLVYPFEYVKDKNVPYEKQYQLWIMNTRFGNEYMQFAENKFKDVH
ncbi:MAG: hypothetical protein JW932_05945 [Deltaproteobacteria bacterium]|nr:hypothetical protein [Deltaproteobacteria bacterium]